MDLIHRIKTYFNFDQEEVKAIIISSLVFGFIFSFSEWNTILSGIRNLIAGIIIVLISIVVHISAQKIMGLQIGGEVRFKLWWYGIIAALILTFVSASLSVGKIILWWIIIPGGLAMKIIPKFRLGKFRYGLNNLQMGIIAFSGPVASIILGTIFKNINLWFTSTPIIIFEKIFIFNLAYAVISSLPIPPLDGHFLFYASRMWYVFIFGMVLIYFILIMTLQIYSWIFAIVGGFVIWLIYYFSFEKGAW